MPIQPGTIIKSFEIIEQVGRGGMAEVYKARHVDLDVNVAIKFIRMERFPQDILHSVVKRFQNEAKKMAQLSHPNIAKVTDYGVYKGIPFLVMEYLPGGTLKKYMGKPMPYQQATRLLLPVANALAYAHSKGVIHRDVKPTNILLSETDQPMLSDFGVAKMIGSDQTQGLTATGASIGTPEYMAPEQALGKKIDQRVDIYSLGVILYELVTGGRPYTADTPMGIINKLINEPAPDPTRLIKGIPQEVKQVLDKALAKEPGKRFADMGAFTRALESMAADAKSNTRSITTRTSKKRRAVPSEKKTQVQQARQTAKKKSFNMRWPSGAMVVVGVGFAIFAGMKMFGIEKDAPASEEQTMAEVATENATPEPEMTNTPQFIPTPTLKTVQIRESDKDVNIETPYIGIAGMNLIPELAEIRNLNIDQSGAMVLSVVPDTPAEIAGLVGCGDNVSNVSFDGYPVPIGGDVIFAADGYRLNDFGDLVNFLRYYTVAGQTIKLKILRDGDIIDIDLTTAARPDIVPGESQRYDEAKIKEAQESGNCRWMGVIGLDMDLEIAEAINLPIDTQGMLIESVSSNSPAETAGLRGGSKSIEIRGEDVLLGGDIIIKINGTNIYRGEQISEVIIENAPGTILLLDIIRNGEIMSIEVALGKCPFK